MNYIVIHEIYEQERRGVRRLIATKKIELEGDALPFYIECLKTDGYRQLTSKSLRFRQTLEHTVSIIIIKEKLEGVTK